MNPQKPGYKPNVVNQTVEFGGGVWQGQPGGDWTLLHPSGGGGGGGDTGGFGGTDMSAIFKQQQDKEAQLLANIRGTISKQETLPAAFTRLSTEQGIPTLQGNINTFNTQIAGTKALLDKLDENINERTKGSMTTEAQRERLLASERQPLETELGRLGAGMAPIASELATAQGNVQAGLSALETQQQKELQPDMLSLSTFNDQAAREVTGYTTENQRKLDVYIQQLKNNQDLSLEQMREAADLAKMEKEYSLKSEQLKSLGKYGAVRYDPTTGTYVTVGGGSSGSNTEGDTITVGPPGKSSSGGTIHNLSNYRGTIHNLSNYRS